MALTTPQWSSVPWQKFPNDILTPGDQVKAWRKEKLPFISNANALQTLDVWEPRGSSPNETTVPPPEHEPNTKGPWIVYIHGGAWRDPSITAASFAATANHLLSDPAAHGSIGGLASLSYTLSSHPHHATDPSPPRDPSQQPDASRAATHPAHIADVLAGLAYLQQHTRCGADYILVGHSCGATLALQAAMHAARWTPDPRLQAVRKPRVVLGLNGLYDLPALVHEPGAAHAHLKGLYETFTREAFGSSEESWMAVSPRYVEDWAAEWEGGARAVLAQSREDSLVPYGQTKGMLDSLRRSAGSELKVDEVEISGDHNVVWEKGDRLAEVLLAIVKEQW